MKTILAGLIVLCAAAMGAQGQAVPLMLRVVKNETSEVKDRYRTGYYSSLTSTDVLSYTIEVTNAGQAPLENVEVRWAILMKPRGSGKPQLTEGSQTLTLARAEKQAVETKPIQTRQSYRTSYSSSSYDVLEEAGHSVEVIVAGKTVASEFKPMDAKQKIEVARQLAAPKPSSTVGPPSSRRSTSTRKP